MRYPLLALCFACALFATGINQDLNKSEWAYWVQAIGSVGAISAAIWLATRENIRRRKEAYALARFTAAGMQTSLKSTEAQVRSICEVLYEYAEGGTPFSLQPLSYPVLMAIGNGLLTVQTWNPQELHNLVALPDRCADKLVTAFGVLSNTAKGLTGFNIWGEDEAKLRQAAAENAKALHFVHVLLSQASQVITREAAFDNMTEG